ncbi:MAG TPA: hypothetical protein VJY31_18380 [Buttiauxella sp.]|nr:hypothetical protein [Buttiauxella sp.]
MRDKTRSYTTDLPCIDLQFLTDIRRRLTDASPGAKLYFQTVNGGLYTFRQADGYGMTINGVTRLIRITTTQAGYGIRQWYVCPHCMKRVAKLYFGSNDVACRECWKLHYKSQSGDRLERMRINLRSQRLAIWGYGYVPTVLNLSIDVQWFPKPKGMRWETFNRKLAMLTACEVAYRQAVSPVGEKLTNGKVDSSAFGSLIKGDHHQL